MKRRQLVSKFLWFWMRHKFNIKKPSLNYIDADGAYGAQCVDLIRSYCKDVFGYNMPKLSKARLLSSDILKSNKRKEVRTGVEDMMMGDIVSVDLVPKNNNGHIFIIYKQTADGYYYIDQNGIGGAYKDGKINYIKGNGVEKRFAKWGTFTILKVFRYMTE